MKTMQTSALSEKSLEAFKCTHEPIVIGESNHPLGVFFSMDDLKQLLTLKEKINTGILSGIEDMEKSRFSEYNDDFIDKFDRELDKRLSQKS